MSGLIEVFRTSELCEHRVCCSCVVCWLCYELNDLWQCSVQGRRQTFSFGGATGGASFATRGAVNGLCRTFRKRPENFWGSHWGGQAKFWGGSGPPLAPPLAVW